MKISKEFSKHATHYEEHNTVQKLVAEKLLSLVKSHPKHILDLGCGSGVLCKSINWNYENFTGVDFAPGMLELHPKSEKIECINGNFNDSLLFENLQTREYDYILSASSLQWAVNLESVFESISKLKAPMSLALFTSGTFKTLNETASIKPLLRSAQEIEKLQKKYFNAQFEVLKYRLDFESVRDMFVYIKRSGVSGSRNLLSYKEMKKLMSEYPLGYLEFEVAFIYS
ncbi:methyltransferase domain-containing protein [Sulfurimonas aquatica]|uniref:Methyltransferase domain-containing protein n=1 Tax=Sulfurimonas aquatica TaxID=2672570 RepID=A0A975B2I4_9BACT|nr:methyltransferase domain-containing protein [Sulfurimonas aquatica]QSZ42989.1 methyltransferase domain-containing protein [Sulfurimonas aquatica]